MHGHTYIKLNGYFKIRRDNANSISVTVDRQSLGLLEFSAECLYQ